MANPARAHVPPGVNGFRHVKVCPECGSDDLKLESMATRCLKCDWSLQGRL